MACLMVVRTEKMTVERQDVGSVSHLDVNMAAEKGGHWVERMDKTEAVWLAVLMDVLRAELKDDYMAVLKAVMKVGGQAETLAVKWAVHWAANWVAEWVDSLVCLMVGWMASFKRNITSNFLSGFYFENIESTYLLGQLEG